VSSRKRAPFVALTTLLRRRFPDVDPSCALSRGQVLVDGVAITNIRARVRADSAIRVSSARPLRGTVKLAHALCALGIDAVGATALDLGAAAGGFTQALLDAGASRVYAVDVGVGQLRGWLRADPRVVNLERTNLGSLGRDLLPEPVDLVTMDLSYLPVSGAIGQLDQRLLSPGAQLAAMVKPTFELRSGHLAAQPEQVATAVATAACALALHGWQVLDECRSPITGTKGAVEVFLHARRR
jgi:23S rRNA (cytidine1920-2'-O)/16S rRNA (cytidine1409-2'-O)-methyltransferase